MSARAWRSRKPGSPFRAELRLTQARNRARRNPGRWIRTSYGGAMTGICYDEAALFTGLPLLEATPLTRLDGIESFPWSDPRADPLADMADFVARERKRELDWDRRYYEGQHHA